MNEPATDQELTSKGTNVNLVQAQHTPVKHTWRPVSQTTKDMFSIAKSTARVIKFRFFRKSCAHSSGYLNNINRDYYASGHRCDTTAKGETIAGAIYKYMDKLENGQICGTDCVRLGHHGTGHGWLRMGHISSNDKAYCGDGLGFETYVSLRNNGIQSPSHDQGCDYVCIPWARFCRFLCRSFSQSFVSQCFRTGLPC